MRSMTIRGETPLSGSSAGFPCSTRAATRARTFGWTTRITGLGMSSTVRVGGCRGARGPDGRARKRGRAPLARCEQATHAVRPPRAGGDSWRGNRAASNGAAIVGASGPCDRTQRRGQFGGGGARSETSRSLRGGAGPCSAPASGGHLSWNGRDRYCNCVRKRRGCRHSGRTCCQTSWRVPWTSSGRRPGFL